MSAFGAWADRKQGFAGHDIHAMQADPIPDQFAGGRCIPAVMQAAVVSAITERIYTGTPGTPNVLPSFMWHRNMLICEGLTAASALVLATASRASQLATVFVLLMMQRTLAVLFDAARR